MAQSCCATGGRFARHWMHIAHLMVDGGKMSKSLATCTRSRIWAIGAIHPLWFATRCSAGITASRSISRCTRWMPPIRRS
nr:hypothetical protein [Verrucomicrobium spinosum]